MGISGACGNIVLKEFPGGEKLCQYEDNIRGQSVFIVQSTVTDSDWMELFLMIDAAKRASAERVIVVMPYMGYMRQDRKSQPRTPISAKLMLNMLETAGASRVITMDLHSQNIQGFADFPLDSLYGSSIFFKEVSKGWGEWVVIAPDMGAIKTAQAYSDLLKCEIAIIPKKRDLRTGKITHNDIIGNVNGKKCLIIDDMTSTGGTLFGAAEVLKSAGAKKVLSFVTHCLDLGGIVRKSNSSENLIDGLFITNTVKNNVNIHNMPPSIRILDTSELFGEAILRTNRNDSISSLFDIKGI